MRATFCNNVGVAVLVAGFAIPIFGFMISPERFDGVIHNLLQGVASEAERRAALNAFYTLAIAAVLSAFCHLVALDIVAKLED